MRARVCASVVLGQDVLADVSQTASCRPEFEVTKRSVAVVALGLPGQQQCVFPSGRRSLDDL